MVLIDLLVSMIMMSLGMMMLPPTLISMPLKLGVFILAGGWHLVVASLIRSF
jgi:flagellar biosynthetic protein FliP